MDSNPKNCPYCGQALTNTQAIAHVRREETVFQQKILAATREAESKAAQQTQAAVLKAVTEASKRHQVELKKANDENEALKRQQQAAVKAAVEKLKPQMQLEARKVIEKDFDQRERVMKGLVQKLETQNKELQERLNRVSAIDRGEFSEEDLVRTLSNAFPEDEFRRIGKGRNGADVLQTVRYRIGTELVEAGRIVYENKDQAQWRTDFIDQAKAARETHETPHVVLVSKVFPNNQKELFWMQGIPVVHPARVVYLAHVMRGLIIEGHRSGLTKEDLSHKLEEIYQYLSSESFQQSMDGLIQAGEEFKQILQQEKKSHERTWAIREQAYNALIKRASGIEAAFRAILERTPAGGTPTEGTPALVSISA